MPNQATAQNRLVASGDRNQSPQAPTTYQTEKNQIHRISRPLASAIAPRIGAITAMKNPLIVRPLAQ